MNETNIQHSLEQLANQNVYGISFLIAYGLTWIICGFLWRKISPRNASLCTLFQGMVAFPIALLLSFAIGALGGERPVDDSITSLSILIGTSQLLGLPLLVYLFIKQRYSLMPYVFAAICSMHFVLYAWLYQTVAYIIMAIAISVGATAIMLVARITDERKRASYVSLYTGIIMIITALALYIVWH